ncbi:MAG: hypothetical protein WBG96_13555, partial [Thermoanaerobaculia bacterium]
MTGFSLLLLIIWLLVPTAVGAWVAKSTGVRYSFAFAVAVAIIVVGSSVFVFLPLPIDRLERLGLALGVSIPVLATLSVVLSPRAWKRPWWLLLWVPLMFAAGVVLAVNINLWLGIP